MSLWHGYLLMQKPVELSPGQWLTVRSGYASVFDRTPESGQPAERLHTRTAGDTVLYESTFETDDLSLDSMAQHMSDFLGDVTKNDCIGYLHTNNGRRFTVFDAGSSWKESLTLVLLHLGVYGLVPRGPRAESGDTWHVAPDGDAGGDGSELNPWNLSHALQRSSGVQQKDTIAVGSGTYTGNFDCTLMGYENEFIDIFFEEGAVIKGTITRRYPYVRIFNAEITSNNTTRSTDESGSSPSIEDDALLIIAPYSHLIHSVIHNRVASGINTANTGFGSHIYHCWIFNNGWVAPDRGHGHCIYTQNTIGTKTIEGCALVQGFSRWGMHAFGSQEMSGFRFLRNTHMAEIFLLDKAHSDIVFNYNRTWKTQPLLYCRAGIEVHNNYLVGGNRGCSVTQNETGIDIQNNTIIGPNTLLEVGSSSLPTIDNNNYYALTGEEKPFGYNGARLTFSEWQALGLDVNSTFAEGSPPTNQVFVEGSKYDNDRALITVYNWEGLARVALDLSALPLTSGRTYRLYNACNPAEYHEFTSDGDDSALPVSMASVDWSVAVPAGWQEALMDNPFPDFGCLVLRVAP